MVFDNCGAGLQGELESVLREELESFGVDPNKESMTNEEYKVAMVKLEKRWQETCAGRTQAEREHLSNMRGTLLWYLQAVSFPNSLKAKCRVHFYCSVT